MPDFLPFRGLRYTRRHDVSALSAPPYDVIDDEERESLERADAHNAVRLILPRAAGATDPYETAARTFRAWCTAGVLTREPVPAFYSYRMSFAGPDGAPHQTSGVIGAIRLPERPGEGGILPHERTLSKARSDRLALLRATRVNLDPIWGLSLAQGLTSAIGSTETAMVATDGTGTRHELGLITDPRGIAAVREVVASQPVVLADGHHRFETACALRAECPGDAGAATIMMLVVELADDQLCVRPIHRLVSGLGDADGLPSRLEPDFDVEDLGANTREGVDALVDRMESSVALGVCTASRLALLRPRGDALERRLADLPGALHDVDAVRFDVGVRPAIADAHLAYRDDAPTVAALVEKGAVDAAVLLRPVTVAQIRTAALDGVRMPEKTSFFVPKPRTGMVFRPLEE